jgi:hypothetical protein
VRLLCPLKRECPESRFEHDAGQDQKRTRKMRGQCYHDRGVAALYTAARHLHEMAMLETLYGDSEEGMFLSQLSLDLSRIADRQSPRNTAAFRAIAAQFPRLFRATAVTTPCEAHL